MLFCAAALCAGCGDTVVTTRPPEAALLSDAPFRERLAIEVPAHSMHAAPRSLFVSGHSLVSAPFPEYLSRLAALAGTPIRMDHHLVGGSSIQQRGAHVPPEGAWDAVLVTEQHGVLGSLLWQDTETWLRRLHDANLMQNPAAATYFYTPWLSIVDLRDPRSWIAYERAADPVWQCIVTRVNAGIAAEGRADRIVTVPASSALAWLVKQRVLAGGEAIERYFTDDVHLTPLGYFYVAVMSHLAVWKTAAPDLAPLLSRLEVPGAQPGDAEHLLAVAGEFLATRAGTHLALTPASCRRYLEDSFNDDYWEYVRRLTRKNNGPIRTAWKTWRWRQQFTAYFHNW